MRAVIFTLLLITASMAETLLSGDIGGMSFSPEANPYLVVDNITIQEGKIATIKAGCIFLFKSFSGMIVDGELVVEGTMDKPVVFTTINDSAYSHNPTQLPNPFDWNGILITNKARRVNMSNFILSYSVYGIKSQKEAFSIENGTFVGNGQFHVTVKDAIKPVIEGMPYTYEADSTNIVANIPPVPDGKNTSEVKKSAPSIQKNVPILIGATGLLTGIVSAVLVKKISDTRTSLLEEKNAAVQTELENQGQAQLTGSIVSGGIAVIAIPTAIILYLRNIGKSPVKK